MSTSLALTPTLDFSTVRVSLDSPVSGFSHTHYPIYLNQNTEQVALKVSYRVYACLNGQPEQAIDVNQHELRILPILRYGQTAGAVPEPYGQGDSEDVSQPSGKRAIHVEAVEHQPQRDHLNTMSFHISSDCLSTGGFETTVRLRLLVLSPVDDVVLSLVDSSRFVVMTRELPKPARMVTYLRDWGFPIADGDLTSKRFRALEERKTKRRKAAPRAFASDTTQDRSPLHVLMPDGSFMFTLRGLQLNASRISPVHPATRTIEAAPVGGMFALPHSSMKRSRGFEQPKSTKKVRISAKAADSDSGQQSDNDERGSESLGDSNPFKLELQLPAIQTSLPAVAAMESLKFSASSPKRHETPLASTIDYFSNFHALNSELPSTVAVGIAQGMNLPLTFEQFENMPPTSNASDYLAALQQPLPAQPLPALPGMNSSPALSWPPF